MTAELQKVIFETMRNNTQIDLQDDRRLKGSHLAWAGYAADAILTAGWSRPRVVSAVEELDALPGGSIVAADWATHQKVLGAWVTFGGPGTTTPELPATVIFEAKPRA